jgi:hypothetical protein
MDINLYIHQAVDQAHQLIEMLLGLCALFRFGGHDALLFGSLAGRFGYYR